METSMDKFIGWTVGEFIDALNLSIKSLILFDEPPGILSSFSFAQVGCPEKPWVRVWLARTQGLFSESGEWSSEIIRQAKVVRIRQGEDVACYRS
jgi:hypothetical protein